MADNSRRAQAPFHLTTYCDPFGQEIQGSRSSPHRCACSEMQANTSQTSSPSGAARRSRPTSRSRAHHQQGLGQDSDEDATTIQMDEYELDTHPHKRYAQGLDEEDDDHEQGEDALMLGPATAADEEAYEMDRQKSRQRARNGRRHVSTGSISDKYDPDDPMHLVSKAVPEHDDPTLPALTWRALLIGSFFCVIGAAIAQLFFYKSNSPSFSSYFVILISLPMGRWLVLALVRRPWVGIPSPAGAWDDSAGCCANRNSVSATSLAIPVAIARRNSLCAPALDTQFLSTFSLPHIGRM